MLHQIQHANGVVYTVAVNPADGLERPYQISTTAGWDTGVYQYDGMGNIHQIGNQEYRYDRLSRLIRGEVEADGVERTQSVSYDDYGNITSLTTNGSTLTTSTSTSTNRLTGLSASYDAGGNLTAITYPNGEEYQYTYDSSNMMKHLQSNRDVARVYLYNADDERVAQFDCPNNSCADGKAVYTWTIRDLKSRVIRVYSNPLSEGWHWVTDDIYNERQALASVKPDESGGSTLSSLHVDHLGTPRQMASDSGAELGKRSYFPFGEGVSAAVRSSERIGFTGHERDFMEEGSTSVGDMDYMRKRYCQPATGKFTSPDPVRSMSLGQSQGWNRFTYALDNPIKFVDLSGKTTVVFIIGRNTDTPETSFGHAAMMTFRGAEVGTINRGSTIPLDKQKARFINSYLSQDREVRAYILNTSAETDGALIDSMKSPRNLKGYKKQRQNCATFCGDVLRDAGLLGKNERPERGFLFDSPKLLQQALEKGSLAKYVEKVLLFSPYVLDEVTEEQVNGLLGITADRKAE